MLEEELLKEIAKVKSAYLAARETCSMLNKQCAELIDERSKLATECNRLRLASDVFANDLARVEKIILDETPFKPHEREAAEKERMLLANDKSRLENEKADLEAEHAKLKAQHEADVTELNQFRLREAGIVFGAQPTEQTPPSRAQVLAALEAFGDYFGRDQTAAALRFHNLSWRP